MSSLIVNHFTDDFQANLVLLLQQRGSRLRNMVTQSSENGQQAVAVDQVGPTTPQRKTSRFEDLPLIDTTFFRRWVQPVQYSWSDTLDTEDKVRMLNDPTNAMVQNGALTIGRAMDDEIIEAFFADSQTGQDGSGTTSFPSSQEVDKSFAVTNSGLNIEKLREARRIFMANDADLDSDQLMMAITATQHDELLGEIEVTSRDFNGGIPTLVNGRVDRFMGINFVHTELLVTKIDGGRTVQRCPVWLKSGMHLGIWYDIRSRVFNREEKIGNPVQMAAEGFFGATRTDEEKVVEIECDVT